VNVDAANDQLSMPAGSVNRTRYNQLSGQTRLENSWSAKALHCQQASKPV
jgi:hypothetical protein